MQELRPVPLTGGITNRNFRVEFNGESFVLRMSGENTELLGIHRVSECAANRAAASLGIAPEVVYFIEPEGYLVTRFVDGNPIPAAIMQADDWLAQVAHALSIFHDQDLHLDATFDIFEVIASLSAVAREHKCQFPANFAALMEHVRAVEAVLRRDPYTPRPCHNDLLNANLLNAQGRLIVLDWEYAGMGDPYFDLANFSHHHSLSDAQTRQLLQYYFGAASEEQFARLKLMEPLSDMREALWGTVQTGISALEEDFAGYAVQWYGSAAGAFADARFGAWLARLKS